MNDRTERLKLAAEDAAGGPPSAEQVDALIAYADALEAVLAARQPTEDDREALAEMIENIATDALDHGREEGLTIRGTVEVAVRMGLEAPVSRAAVSDAATEGDAQVERIARILARTSTLTEQDARALAKAAQAIAEAERDAAEGPPPTSIHHLDLLIEDGEVKVKFRCNAIETADCRRRPADWRDRESWSVEEATETGHPCWAAEWIDSTSMDEAVFGQDQILVSASITVVYDEGVEIALEPPHTQLPIPLDPELQQPWKHEGHNPVQHRDGNPPWCRECRWTSPQPAIRARNIKDTGRQEP